jgi:hypothetical protein
LGKKAKKIKKKAARAAAKTAARLDPPEVGTQYQHGDESREDERRAAYRPTRLAGPPDYPESAQAAQRMSTDDRKRRSPIKKKTIKAMHWEINRRITSVGEEGLAMLDTDVTDHEKFVTLTRQTGNIGDTLAGADPAPELVRSELIRVMAIAGLWAQSLAGKRRRR